MKRKPAGLLFAALLCLAAAGCNSDKPASTVTPQTTPTPETTASKPVTETTPGTTATTGTAAEATTTAPAAAAMSDADIENLGSELYEQACALYFGLFCTSTDVYETDFASLISHDGIDYALVTDDVTSLDDVRTRFRTVFADSFPEQLDERFLVQDGKLYRTVSDRGEDISYTGSVLSFVSKTDTTLQYSATACHADPETMEVLDSVVRDFTLTLEDDGWRVSAFTLPY